MSGTNKWRVGMGSALVLCGLLSGAWADAAPQREARPARQIEGVARLEGFRDIPFVLQGDGGTQPVVVVVNYLSEADMDGFAGDARQAVGVPRTDPRYFWRLLAGRVVAQGMSVLRYNALGIGCQPVEAVPVRKVDADGHEQTPFCAHDEDSARIEPRHYVDALASVLVAARERLAVPRLPVILVAHSGNSRVVADFVQSGAAQASGVDVVGWVGIAPLLSTGAEALRQQHGGWALSKIAACPADDWQPCALAVLDSLPGQGLLPVADWKALIASAGGDRDLAMSRLAEAANEAFLRARNGLEASLGSGRLGRSGAGLLIREGTAADMLVGGQAPAAGLQAVPASAIFLGGNDYLLTPELQQKAWLSAGGQLGQIHVLEGLGHTLSHEPLAGAMSEQALSAVTAALARMARADAPVHPHGTRPPRARPAALGTVEALGKGSDGTLKPTGKSQVAVRSRPSRPGTQP